MGKSTKKDSLTNRLKQAQQVIGEESSSPEPDVFNNDLEVLEMTTSACAVPARMIE